MSKCKSHFNAELLNGRMVCVSCGTDLGEPFTTKGINFKKFKKVEL